MNSTMKDIQKLSNVKDHWTHVESPSINFYLPCQFDHNHNINSEQRNVVVVLRELIASRVFALLSRTDTPDMEGN